MNKEESLIALHGQAWNRGMNESEHEVHLGIFVFHITLLEIFFFKKKKSKRMAVI